MAKLKVKEKLHFSIKSSYIFMILILVVASFLGIGYAQITGISLNIDGEATATPASEVLITNITYLSSNLADPDDCTINDPYLTFMGSQIDLGNDPSSTITYKIKVRNNASIPATYDTAIYSVDMGYDNSDIEFAVNGITSGEVLNPGAEKEFTITFQYISSLNTVTNSVLNSYINFNFALQNKVARVGTTYFDTLQEAIDSVTTSAQTTVELLQDTSEAITISSSQNIILDLKNFTLSNDGNTNVIQNNGTLRISSGTISSDASTNGAINNNKDATFLIDGGQVIMTGGRQALYNDKGNATITGTAYLTSSASERAAVQNLAGSTMLITGGTITSTGTNASKSNALNNLGTLTIGVKDGIVSTTSPFFQSESAPAIIATSAFNFYDGVVKSRSNPFNDLSKIADMEVNYGILTGTEVIDGKTYNVARLGVTKQVTFNPSSGVIADADRIRYVEVGHAVGVLPTVTRSGFYFNGWWTTATTGGREIDATEIINDTVTFYARWSQTNDVAQIGNNLYSTLQAAITAAPNNTQTTIKLLKNVSEILSVPATKNIVFDLEGRTLTNSGNKPIIENRGTVSISNGTFYSNASQGIINNVSGHFTISGGSFTAVGDRQAVYVTGGTVEITGDSYFVSSSSGVPSGSSARRATVQNVSGTVIITGGTIVGLVQEAVTNQSIMTIGVKDGSVNSSTPVIIGENYGLLNTGTTTLNFYDGIIKGINGAISGTVNDYETTLVGGTELIDGKTYITECNS